MPRRRIAPFAFIPLAAALAGPAAAGVPAPVGDVMAAEFALQQGDLATASRYYLLAAQLSDDPEVAERAARVALAAGEPDRARRAIERWAALAPESLEMRSAALSLALAQGEEAAALEHAQVLVDEGSDSAFGTLLATLAEARGDAAVMARAVMRQLFTLRRLPDQFQAWLAFAATARRLDGQRLSEEIVLAGMERYPDDPRARLLTASRQREAGDAAAARATLASLGDPAKMPADVRRLAAGELARLGDPVAAAGLLAHGEQDEASYRQRAAWLADADDRAGLQALYAELRATGAVPPPERRLLLGHLAEALGLWAEALAWYRGVPVGAGHDLARLRQAGALVRLDRRDEGLALLRELQVDESADGELRRDAYLHAAVLSEDAGDAGAALRAYDQGLAVFEDDPVLLYGRAMLHERGNRVDAALADLRRIIDDNPDDAQALNAYGYTLGERRGAWAEALPFLEKAHALEPDSGPVLDSLGWALFRLGRPLEALPLLQLAWKRLEDAEIAAHLGEVLWRMGREAEAREIWAAGQRIDPDNRALRRALEAFAP